MFTYQPAVSPNTSVQTAQRLFQRVSVNMSGRLMLANHEEYSCTVTEMSPGDVCVSCAGVPALKERVIAYIDHLGRIEGTVLQTNPTGFEMSITATDRKREKLAAQLTWLANRHELGLPEDRRHDRLSPKITRAELAFEDGRRYSCRILDLSLSGAAVEIDVRPEIGTAVRLNSIRGRIVRHFSEGVAVEFATVQSRESLYSLL
jgi:hypothetical protein